MATTAAEGNISLPTPAGVSIEIEGKSGWIGIDHGTPGLRKFLKAFKAGHEIDFEDWRIDSEGVTHYKFYRVDDLS